MRELVRTLLMGVAAGVTDVLPMAAAALVLGTAIGIAGHFVRQEGTI